MTSPESPDVQSISSGDYFFASEANRRFATGEARRLPSLVSQSMVLGITSIVLAVLAAWLFNPSLSTLVNWIQLQRSGTSVRGLVADHYADLSYSAKYGDTSYYSLTYKFVVLKDGSKSTYTALQRIYGSTYYQYPVNAMINVLYLPTDPTVNMIPDDTAPYSVALFLSAAGAIVTLINLFLLILLLQCIIYTGRLAHEGLIIDGSLDSAKRQLKPGISGRQHSISIKITYHFRDPHINLIKKKSVTLYRSDLRNKSLPVPGTPIRVIYLDAKHYELL
jgi:hypothetical protein